MSTTPTSPSSERPAARALRGVILAFSLAAALAGCTCGAKRPCSAGAQACTCRADQSCDAGLSCQAGACAPCTAGQERCGCLSNGTCASGLACRSGSTCEACTDGTESCPCRSDTTCDAGLLCRNAFCVTASACPAGTLDCPCDVGGTCAATLTCSSGLCHACTSDVAGCPCDAGVCQGLVCDGGTCRVARACTDACGAHQQCTWPTATTDAVCLPDCVIGFTWNAGASACDPIPGATCGPGTGSIAAACAGVNRTCIEDAIAAQCGECVSGFLEEAGTCRAVKTCETLGCAANHLTCTEAGAHADASCGGCLAGYQQSGSTCIALTCADRQAECDAANAVCEVPLTGGAVCGACKSGNLRDATTGVCRLPYTCQTLPTPCTGGQVCTPGTATADAFCRDPSCPPCNGPGEDGIWPALSQGGKCICKTLPGYFYTLSGLVGAYPCDADQDGWTRVTAWYALTNADPAIQANARCDLRTVNAFVLHNDQGQQKTFTLGETLPLYETVRNDDQGTLDLVAGGTDVPVYGGYFGRALRAAELNSLTKACVTERADHNDNKVADIAEWGRPNSGQVALPGGTFSGDMLHWFELYTRFSYFIELDRGWYEPGAAGAPGTYHVAERDRTTGSGFPLVYGRESSGQFTSDYWRECPRARDVWYSDLLPPIGMDFASWSAPSRPSLKWNGMGHSSQFKCVQVVDDATYAASNHAENRQIQKVATLGDPPAAATGAARADYLRATMNGCAVDPGAGRPASGKNPTDPIITCGAGLPDPSQVGFVLWAAVRLADTSTYYRGCILQCNGFPYLCPGVDPEHPSSQGCFHLCADMAGSEAVDLRSTSNGYRLRGEVPVSAPIADGPVQDTGSGYKVTPR